MQNLWNSQEKLTAGKPAAGPKTVTTTAAADSAAVTAWLRHNIHNTDIKSRPTRLPSELTTSDIVNPTQELDSSTETRFPNCYILGFARNTLGLGKMNEQLLWARR